MRATRRYWQAVVIGVLAVVGLIAVVVLLSQGGGSPSNHGGRSTAAGRRRTKTAGVTRIRPIAMVNDVTSTGETRTRSASP